MTALLTVIGRGVRIRGRVQGEGDLTIEGYVDGDVAVSGELTVDAHGLVAANVSARVIVVRGAVRGNLTGEEVVRLEEGARVVGDLHAPRIGIAKGALVRGLVQTGTDGASASRSRAQAAASRSSSASSVKRAAPSAAVSHASSAGQASAPAPRAAASASSVSKSTANGAEHARATSTSPRTAISAASASSKGPPPPVVPSLKKGAKAALKKKAT